MILTDTDRTELASVKQFWNKYGRLTLISALAFVVIFGAIHFWRKGRIATSAKASHIFQEMMFAELQQSSEDATAKGTQLITEYKNTPYADFASLFLAKMAVANGDLDTAAEKLRWVVDKSGVHTIAKHLATVRLSSVLQQQGKLDEALSLVAADPDPAYITLYAQARGDIYTQKGELDKARDAYKLAVQSLPPGAKAPLLQMKSLDIGSVDEE